MRFAEKGFRFSIYAIYAHFQEAEMIDHRVYISRMIPEKAIRLLEDHCSVEVNREDRQPSRSELLGRVKGMLAGLDVSEREPEVETGLLALDSAVLSPHLESSPLDTRDVWGTWQRRISRPHCAEKCRHNASIRRHPGNAIITAVGRQSPFAQVIL